MRLIYLKSGLVYFWSEFYLHINNTSRMDLKQWGYMSDFLFKWYWISDVFAVT